jgi:hypothetical protein
VRAAWVKYGSSYLAENGRSTDALVAEIVNNKTDTFMESGNAVLRFEAIKYLGSEILLRKNSSDERK